MTSVKDMKDHFVYEHLVIDGVDVDLGIRNIGENEDNDISGSIGDNEDNDIADSFVSPNDTDKSAAVIILCVSGNVSSSY